ncbi:histone-lysine N-methyltransferase SETMAR [Trichonephila clavipes]|nr:histone-lysine N-methyltransferase SETMAR [Trichonephila clavipes]
MLDLNKGHKSQTLFVNIKGIIFAGPNRGRRRHFGVGSNLKNITDAHSNDENETNNAAPVPTSSEMRNVLKSEHASQVAEIANGVYGAGTVTANYVQFWFRGFRSGIFDVKDAPRTGRLVVENVDKITEVIKVDRHVSSRSISQKLKIDLKTVLSHLRKVGLKKKLHVWVPHQLTPKNMMDRISICEALAKRNEIDPFLKWMVTGDEK